jgi:hypothetical protein
LIISNWILFLISSLVIWFDFFSNLGLIFLIAIYFVLESFSWLICFYSNSTPGHLFSFNFYVKFNSNSFNWYFLFIFYWICFLQFHP